MMLHHLWKLNRQRCLIKGREVLTAFDIFQHNQGTMHKQFWSVSELRVNKEVPVNEVVEMVSDQSGFPKLGFIELSER